MRYRGATAANPVCYETPAPLKRRVVNGSHWFALRPVISRLHIDAERDAQSFAGAGHLIAHERGELRQFVLPGL
jgi:hypothetical protein